MFNSLIHPRNPAKVFSDALQSLFCHEGIVEPGEWFHPSHFVPLVFYSSKLKRKCQCATRSVSCQCKINTF